jgi:hypothetical protein
VNDRRHLYLYAKGHYIQSDIIQDLKTIVAKMCMMYPEHVEKTDIIHWLLKEVYQHIKTEEDFFKFFSLTYYSWGNKIDIIRNSLSFLRFIRVKDIDIELGQPDPSVLPLSKEN